MKEISIKIHINMLGKRKNAYLIIDQSMLDIIFDSCVDFAIFHSCLIYSSKLLTKKYLFDIESVYASLIVGLSKIIPYSNIISKPSKIDHSININISKKHTSISDKINKKIIDKKQIGFMANVLGLTLLEFYSKIKQEINAKLATLPPDQKPFEINKILKKYQIKPYEIRLILDS